MNDEFRAGLTAGFWISAAFFLAVTLVVFLIKG